MGYMVAYKPTRTKKKENMFFGTFYDCHGIVFDTVHFPDSATKFPLRGRGFYFIKGRVMDDFGVPIIEARWMEKVPMAVGVMKHCPPGWGGARAWVCKRSSGA